MGVLHRAFRFLLPEGGYIPKPYAEGDDKVIRGGEVFAKNTLEADTGRLVEMVSYCPREGREMGRYTLSELKAMRTPRFMRLTIRNGLVPISHSKAGRDEWYDMMGYIRGRRKAAVESSIKRQFAAIYKSKKWRTVLARASASSRIGLRELGEYLFNVHGVEYRVDASVSKNDVVLLQYETVEGETGGKS